MEGTFWNVVDDVATQSPDAILLADDHGRHLTAAQLRDEALAVAGGLVANGVTSGDVVSWQLPTTLEAAVMLAAGARIGVVHNPIIPLLRHKEVGHICSQLESALLIVPQIWRGFDHGLMARELGIAHVALDFESPVTPTTPMRLPKDPTVTLPPAPTRADECRWVYYSSGTTSTPKGVRHTDTSAMAASLAMIERCEFDANDVYPIAWPFTHIGGIAMLTTALRTRMKLVLFDTFDAAVTPLRMAEHQPTILGSALPFFRAYIAAQRAVGERRLFPHVRLVVAGGAPTPQELNEEIIEVLGVRGAAGLYGLTEFPNVTGEWWQSKKLGLDVGPIGPGCEARVVNGELQLRGVQGFLGYVDESLNAEAFTEDGWFRTGDLGSIDQRGHIQVTGRLKDVVIRNAENISASEVEEAVLFHPKVRDVAVIGLPDPATGERVVAAVVLDAGDTVTVAELAEHCVSLGLAKYKCPAQVVPIAAIERNPMGKIQKDRVRDAVNAAMNSA